MNELQAKELESCTPMYRVILTKAYAGKSSPRAAIKAMCLSCVGYLRVEITNCSAYGCPLHVYRPYQDGSDDVDSDVNPSEAAGLAISDESGKI